MAQKYNKNKENMLFSFTNAAFPKELVFHDCLQHSEILFSEKETEPELCSSKIKASCFIVEDCLESKKKGKFSKPSTNVNVKKTLPLQNPNPNNWNRGGKAEVPEEGTGDFFDNFKGKTDQSQVNKFLKEKKFESLLQISKENSLQFGPSLENSDNIETSIKTNQQSNPIQHQQTINKVEINYSKDGKSDDKSIDKFFEEFDTTTQNKVFSINCIYKVNEFLSYPKEEPLWYFYHETAKSSYGPISSKKLEEMFNNKIIDQSIQLRFIDIFSHKLSKKPFTYFKLSDVDRTNFLNDIELSTLFYAAESIIKNAKRSVLSETKTNEEADLFSNFNTGKTGTQKEKISKKTKGRPIDANIKLGIIIIINRIQDS